MMYHKCSATTGTRRLCPGGEAGATLNATVSGGYVFSSSTAVQNLACTGVVGLTAHPMCIVRRNVRVSLYQQHRIHFFLVLLLREIIQKTYFGPHLKGTLT
jgi:hypothetical protein